MAVTGYRPIDSPVEERRFVNDSIHDVAQGFDGDPEAIYQFLCECGDRRCERVVSLTLADYAESQAGSVRAY